MNKLAPPLLLLPAACAGVPHHADLAAPAPGFVAEQFFAGRTEGRGALTVLMKHPQLVQVHGTGHLEPDGTLVLDQDVEQAGKPPKHREWRIVPAGPGRYAGTLTDAIGPITGSVSGNCLHLRFRGKGGLHYQQWIYLQPGGQVALNRMSVRKWGMPVAKLSETITRVAP